MLYLSPFQSDQSLHLQDPERQGEGNRHSATVADTDVVSWTIEYLDRSTTHPAKKQKGNNNATHRPGTPTVEENDDGGLPCVGASFRNRGLSQKATSILIASWRHSTKNEYRSYISKWLSFCKKWKICEVSPTVNNIIEFLTDLYGKGHSYSSINVARSSLSSLGISIESFTAGSHPLVVRFLKGVFNTRPPQPRYSTIWDINVVLTYLRTLSPVKHLSLKDLTLKMTMLMALTNAARVDTVHKLLVTNVQKLKSEFIVQIDGLLKQSRPGFSCPSLSFKAFPPDRRLCIYVVLKEYLHRTKNLRKGNKLLISYVKPHHAITKDTVARWLKVVMIRSGINVKVFGPHSVRTAASSKASEKCVPIKEILQTGGWSNVGTFAKFYKKPIQSHVNFATAILSK